MKIRSAFNSPCCSGLKASLALLYCSALVCAIHASLPTGLPINPEAGRGGALLVTVQLEDGQGLLMALDTGAGTTVLDKSLEPKLGKSHGTIAAMCVDGKTKFTDYTAPKLYLGGARLLMTGSDIGTWNVNKRLSTPEHHPVLGILGIDVLEHYCVQLDFAAGKMRFLDDQHADKSTWGQAFPIAPISGQDPRFAVAGNLLGQPGTHSLVDSGWLGDGWLMPKHFQQWTNVAVAPTNGEALAPDAVFAGEKYPWVDLAKEDWPSDGMGLNFMARHLVTLDFPNHTLYLRRQAIYPLPYLRMMRLKPIEDKEPELTAHVRTLVVDWIGNKEQAGDYTAPAWKNLLSKRKDIEAFTKRTGNIVSLTLVERRRGVFGWRRTYSYRMEFSHATTLGNFVFSGRNKLSYGNIELLEWKEDK